VLRKLHILVLIGMTCAWGLRGAHAQQIDLGPAGNYSGFFFRHATNLQDVQGRLAVGGNLYVHSTSVGAKLPPGSTQPSLVVGGKILRFDSGSIWAGAQTNSFGLYRGSKQESVPAYLDLRKSDVLGVDFDAERDSLSFLSSQLRASKSTGAVTVSYSSVKLTGSGAAVEVFALSPDQVRSGHDLQLQNVRDDAYIVLNIASDKFRSVRLGITMTVLKGRQQKVLINVFDAQILQMTNVQVWGSVLAPYACVCRSNGHVEGSVMADSWDSAMGIGYAPFKSMF
jgi:choice-of-anchor A domain-containing protein